MNIGDRIKQLREDKGLTLEQVGKYIGVNKATVQRYETGEIDIKRNTAIKLSEILSTSPAYIMGWSDTPCKVEAVQQDEISVLFNKLNEIDKIKVTAFVEGLLASDNYKQNSISEDMAKTVFQNKKKFTQTTTK